MLIHLHKQATTAPKVRAAIQVSTEPASALAARFGTTENAVLTHLRKKHLGYEITLMGLEWK